MTALVAKWVDNTKDDEILAVTRSFEEKNRCPPQDMGESESEKLLQNLAVPELQNGRIMEPPPRKPVPVQMDYVKVAKQVWAWSFGFDETGPYRIRGPSGMVR